MLVPAEISVLDHGGVKVGDPSGWSGWRAAEGIPVGTPFLISPGFEYDIELNAFFYSVDMLAARMATRVGYARDLRSFFSFLHRSRGGTTWRDASEDDHRAYLIWRREDPAGPRVSDSTWDREVAGVNRFFCWQVAQGHVSRSPITQRRRRAASGSRSPQYHLAETPAAYSHGRRRERIEWFSAKSYRLWRDVGVAGHGSDGLPDPRFRGRWASRNSAFMDLMVRTGMRITEQSSLTNLEVPWARGTKGYQRFWLPAAVAKGGSARWVYVPSSVARDLSTYIEIDRREVIDEAQARGRYDRLSGDALVLDTSRKTASLLGDATAERVKLAYLTPAERSRLFVEGPHGLEPAAFWLNEAGMPMSVATWKDLFRQANARCGQHGVALHGHAHMLRHTFAVLTLEQMQRGHIAALAQLNPDQRGHYTRIFGDPLDWVRRCLGHRSVVTTQVYLHALEELEMETRLALISEAWEDPRHPRALVHGESSARDEL